MARPLARYSSFVALIICVFFYVFLINLNDEVVATLSSLVPFRFVRSHYAIGLAVAALIALVVGQRLLDRSVSLSASLLQVLVYEVPPYNMGSYDLLCIGADPDRLDVLQQACRAGNLKAIDFLLRAGCAVKNSQLGKISWSSANVTDIVRTLLAAGCDPTHSPAEALVSACHANAPVSAVELLLNAGVDPNSARLSGHTALHEASRSCVGDASLIRLLLARGGNSMARSRTGLTPLHLAHNAAAVFALVEVGADPNTRALNSCVPLHMASSEGVAAALIHCGAQVDLRTVPQQLAPLHMASRLQALPMMLCLLGAGADPNARSHAGSTLHHAVARFRGAYPAITLLLAAGASPAERNTRGNTPLAHLAERCLSLPAGNASRLRAVSRAIGALLCAGATLQEIASLGEGRLEMFMTLVVTAGLFGSEKMNEATLVMRWKAEAKEKL